MLPSKPVRRIVSLVPSLTETLVHLGLRAELVGCTSYCVEPPSLHRQVAVVGGTKDFDVARILALSPTHIVANREENTRELVETLMDRVPTVITFPTSPSDVPDMVRTMGKFLGCEASAGELADQISVALAEARESGVLGRRFLYLIWRDPYMIAGADTYISRLLESAGWINAYQGSERYPSVTIDEINQLAPDHIFLSTEPFSFRNRHVEMLRAEGVTCVKIGRIDGRTCSWFGWRTLEALRYVRALEAPASSQAIHT